MRAVGTWKGGFQTQLEDARGHAVIVDLPPDEDGGNLRYLRAGTLRAVARGVHHDDLRAGREETEANVRGHGGGA